MLTAAGILLLVSTAAFSSETPDPIRSKQQPHPPTTHPPAIQIQTQKPSAPPSVDFNTPEKETPALSNDNPSSGSLSGYIAFLAGALLLLRQQN